MRILGLVKRERLRGQAALDIEADIKRDQRARLEHQSKHASQLRSILVQEWQLETEDQEWPAVGPHFWTLARSLLN